ncbi:uncharacterized protein LOC143526689 [Brachyhypopomus gauderio]|uniref:uncharacterized protein LOC143526689 n=1 Tax=Brachyhypopomus gauderio TaxID=698409 RepID=UPI0040416480
MENIETEMTKVVGDPLGLSVLPKQFSLSDRLLSDLCCNTPFRNISDETFPYMSAILEDTMDISSTPKGTDDCSNAQLNKITNEDEVVSGSRSPVKTNDSSWLCMPEKIDQAVGVRMSLASPQNDNEELTQTISKESPYNLSSSLPKSSICNEKCYMLVESDGTFDISKGSKEGSSVSDSTKAVNCARAEPNNTFEKSPEPKENNSPEPNSTVSINDGSLQGDHEMYLKSSIDFCGPSNVTTGQPNKKNGSTVDITNSDVSKQEQCNEALVCGEDCEKHGTFTKEINMTFGLTGVMEQTGIASLHASTELAEPLSKHDATADLAHPRPLPTLKISNLNIIEDVEKTSNVELPPQSSGAGVCDAVLSGSSDAVSTTAVPAVNVELAACYNRTADLPEAETKGVNKQADFQRRNGVSDGDCHLNLNFSNCSSFSLDDTLDMKTHALVTSTPIILNRGFDRLESAKLTELQKRLSVINSIDVQSTDNLDGISEHDGSDTSKTSSSSNKAEIQKVSEKSSTVSKSPAVSKPPSKLAVKRKIPQAAFKSSIPKTQIQLKPPIAQDKSALVNSKVVPATRALKKPETSAASLQSLRKTVEMNKIKNLGPAKRSMTAATERLSAMPSSGCNVTADLKPSNSHMTKPKVSRMPVPGQRRLGVHPAGGGAVSAEITHSQTASKPSGLTGIRQRSSLLPSFAQKHASNDVLPLAKRKKTDMQELPACPATSADPKPGDGDQAVITDPRDSQIKGCSTGCESCTLIQEKLCTFHQELGEFLQERRNMPAGCEWLPWQQKLKVCLEEFTRLQAAHQ